MVLKTLFFILVTMLSFYGSWASVLRKRTLSDTLFNLNYNKLEAMFQISNMDSAYYYVNVLSKHKNPDYIEHFYIYIAKSQYFYYIGKIDSALYYNDQALTLTQKTSQLSNQELSLVYRKKSLFQFTNGQNQEAKNSIKQAIENDKSDRSNQQSLAVILSYEGAYDSALMLLFENLKHYTYVEKNLTNQYGTLIHIANTYSISMKDSLALVYYKKALGLSDHAKNRLFSKGSCLMNIGVVWLNMEKKKHALDSAEHYLTLAIPTLKESKDSRTIAYASYMLGSVFTKKKEYTKAIQYINDGIKENPSDLHEAYLDLATCYMGLDQYDSVQTYLEKIKPLNDLLLVHQKIEWYQLQYELFKKLGNYGKSLEAHEALLVYKDSIFITERETIAQETEARFNVFSLQKEQEKKDLLAAYQLKKQKWITLFSVIGFVLLSIGIYLFYQRRRLQNKLQIEQQAKELSQLNWKLKEINEAHAKEMEHIAQTAHAASVITPTITEARLKEQISEDKNWLDFMMQFNQLHGGFIEKIQTKFPQLSSTELRLCALLKLNLETKEIASLLSVDPSSILTKKYRIKKKLGEKAEEFETILKN
jgi:tetratricopeptide (TPR) repeat protein